MEARGCTVVEEPSCSYLDDLEQGHIEVEEVERRTHLEEQSLDELEEWQLAKADAGGS